MMHLTLGSLTDEARDLGLTTEKLRSLFAADQTVWSKDGITIKRQSEHVFRITHENLIISVWRYGYEGQLEVFVQTERGPVDVTFNAGPWMTHTREVAGEILKHVHTDTANQLELARATYLREQSPEITLPELTA